MRQRITGSLTGTGAGTMMSVMDSPNGQPGMSCSIYGTFSATVQLERSRDSGVTFNVVSETPAGAGAIYTAEADIGVSDPIVGTIYRWHCTAYTSGTILYDLAQ